MSSRRLFGIGASIFVAGAVTGCGNLSGILSAVGVGSNTVTLRLVNDTAFRVEPGVYVSGEIVLDELGISSLTEDILGFGINRQGFGDLSAGASTSRTYDCRDAQVVMVQDAELKTGFGFSPDADSELFREGRDYRCGDTLTVRYTGDIGGFNARITSASFDALAIVDALAGLQPR